MLMYGAYYEKGARLRSEILPTLFSFDSMGYGLGYKLQVDSQTFFKFFFYSLEGFYYNLIPNVYNLLILLGKVKASWGHVVIMSIEHWLFSAVSVGKLGARLEQSYTSYFPKFAILFIIFRL